MGNDGPPQLPPSPGNWAPGFSASGSVAWEIRAQSSPTRRSLKSWWDRLGPGIDELISDWLMTDQIMDYKHYLLDKI